MFLKVLVVTGSSIFTTIIHKPTAKKTDKILRPILVVNQFVILPDEEGRIEMNLPYGTWYLKESQAPEGYLLSDKIVKIVIGEEGVFADDTLLKQDDSYAISFANMPIPSKSAETGDISRFSYVLLCIISCFLFILLKKKYEDAY